MKLHALFLGAADAHATIHAVTLAASASVSWAKRCRWPGDTTGSDELRGHVAVEQRETESSRPSCLFVTRCRALITSTHRR